MELWRQSLKFEQVFGAYRTVQATVKHHQVKTFTGRSPQYEPTATDEWHVERGNRVAGQQGIGHGELFSGHR